MTVETHSNRTDARAAAQRWRARGWAATVIEDRVGSVGKLVRVWHVIVPRNHGETFSGLISLAKMEGRQP